MAKLKRIAAFILAAITIFCLAAGVKHSGAYTVYTLATAKRKLPIYSVEREDKKIAISFDCAWGVEHTDELLSTMEKYNVKCTFFAVQFWIEKYPDYAKKIVGKGHGLETHSKTHPKMSKLSRDEIKAELTSSKDAIEKVTGRKVTLFRPPFGDYNDKVITCAEELGLYPIQWDVDSLDWKDYGADNIVKTVLNHKNLKDGAIILMHNGAKYTKDALPRIIEGLKEKGYEIVPVSQIIYTDNYEINHAGEQIKK